MNTWQNITVGIILIVSLLAAIKGFYQVKIKKDSFRVTPWFFLLGIFVWGDSLVLSLFWLVVCLAALLLQNWDLFLLIVSLFWTVRSLGETIYWINEQFAPTKRNNPKDLFGYSIFQNGSIVLGYQVFWQCMTVVSALITIYFVFQWTQTLK